MSGQLVGEVNRAGRRLKTAGVPRLAARALSIVAECVRDNRLGPVPLDYLAGAMEGAGERTASRALAQLRDLGLVEMVRRGGGRGHTGRPALYRLVDVDRWLTDHGVPAPEVAAQSRAGHAGGGELAEFDRHDGGGWIAPDGDWMPDPGAFPADSPANTGDSIRENGGSIGDSPAKSGRLSRHLGGDLPVPVRTPGVGTTDVTTGPHAREHNRPPPRSRPRSETPGQLPLTAVVRNEPEPVADDAVGGATGHGPAVDDRDVPDDSWCGRPDCRSPAACGPCGRAKDLHAAEARAEAQQRAQAERRAAWERAQHRIAAAADCPLGCDRDGYIGKRVCDHEQRRPVQTIGDYLLVRSIAAASTARAAARKRGELAPLGRAHDPTIGLRGHRAAS